MSDHQRIRNNAPHRVALLGWSLLSWSLLSWSLLGFASANAQNVPAQPTATGATLSIAGVAGAAQAAYFSGNAAELERLATATSAWAKSSSTREQYTYAYVQFRALQVAIGAKRKDVASKAGDACVDTVDAIVKHDPKFAEAFALQSACYGYMTNLGGMAAIRNGSKSGKSIEAALALEPRNPRILLVDGFGVYFRPKFVGGDKAKGCVRFREAAAGFDAAAGASSAGIDWGVAESHYWAGRCAQDAGDANGARREFERAVTIAPDFLAAKRALTR